MDEELSQPDSVFLLNQSCRRRLDNGGDDDRLSELPNEILFLILSLLPVRRAASTTVLSSRWLDLWKQIPDIRFNLESDRISQLPDRIISDILSFLPLKKAAATSVLSSRWSDTWKQTPNLDFNYRPFFGVYDSTEAVCKCMEVVNLVLQSHKALSLKLFTICLYVDKSAKWAVIKWLEFVFMRKVEILELNFCCFKDQDIVVLKELLRELNTICGDPQTLIFFQSLKSLHLASLEVSGEDIELFLGNCPLLESLSICFANLTSDIEVCSPMLKRLELYECRGGKSIKVAAPNLAFIRFSEGAGRFLYENVPRLVKASFAIGTSEFVTKHLASFPISILQFLNIYLPPRSKMFWTIAFPQMPNLKKLSVVCFETCVQSLLPVTHVIWAAPRLEEFRLQLLIYREEPHMQGITDGGRSPHQHLKVFHLDVPYDNQQQGVSDHVVELLTYVGNNCVALRRMEVVGPNVPVLTRKQLQSQLPDHVQLSIKPPWYR